MMKTFDHAIRLRVVACCTISDNSKLVTQFVPQSGFELGSSIRSDCGGSPKTTIHPLKKASATVSDLMSTSGPTCEPIDASQLIFETF